MKQLLLFLFVICQLPSLGQTVRQPLIVNYPAIGAYSKTRADVFSMLVNPAALARVKGTSAGVYAERRFSLSAFSQYTAAVALPTSSGNFGIQADYFGYSNYNETQLGLAYGRSLGKKLDVGVKFNYYNLRIPGYIASSTFHFEAGAVMHLTDQLHAGFSVFNPVGGVLNKQTDEKIASVYRGGLGYEVSDKFFITADVVKEENKEVGVLAAFEYAFIQQLKLRAGVNTVNNQPFMGVGLYLGPIRVDVAGSWHQQLGFTPAVQLLFDFSKKKEVAE